MKLWVLMHIIRQQQMTSRRNIVEIVEKHTIENKIVAKCSDVVQRKDLV